MSEREFQTDFDIFWAAYPRRHAKKDALKAWRQLHPSAETVQLILNALTWQKQTDQWKRNIIPLAGSYLRGERWEDEAQAYHCRPQPTEEDLEWAQSIAREKAREQAAAAEQARAAIDQRAQALIALGVDPPQAVMQASREWLRTQR